MSRAPGRSVGLSFPGVEVRWRGLTVEAIVPHSGNQLPSVARALSNMGKSAGRAAAKPFGPLLRAAGLAAPSSGGTAGATGDEDGPDGRVDSQTRRRVIINNTSGVLKPVRGRGGGGAGAVLCCSAVGDTLVVQGAGGTP